MPDPIVMVVIRGQDLDGLRRFYREVFGWDTEEVAPGFASVETVPHEHDEAGNDILPQVVLSAHGWRFEGERHQPRMHQPGAFIGVAAGDPTVTAYVEVEDVAATLAKAEHAGGTIVQPVTDIPGFTLIARFADPAGNVIGLQQQQPYEEGGG